MSVKFKFLGTGAGPGVPAFYCDCVACREARQDPRRARTRSGAIIDAGEARVLIDAPPDLRLQLVRERITGLDVVFLTHWHYDHFGGLGELEFYVHLVRHQPLGLYLPPSAEERFKSAFPHLLDVIEPVPWQFERPYQLGPVTITPLAANHGIEAAGMLVEADGRLAYFADTYGLPPATLNRVKGVDILACDATFHGENWYPSTHMTVEQAIELGRQVGAGRTILTHLSMHYAQATTAADLEKEISAFPNVSLAYDGLELGL